MEMQKGDVPVTFANTDLLFDLTGYRPTTPLAQGVAAFVDWYQKLFSKLSRGHPFSNATIGLVSQHFGTRFDLRREDNRG